MSLKKVVGKKVKEKSIYSIPLTALKCNNSNLDICTASTRGVDRPSFQGIKPDGIKKNVVLNIHSFCSHSTKSIDQVP